MAGVEGQALYYYTRALAYYEENRYQVRVHSELRRFNTIFHGYCCAAATSRYLVWMPPNVASDLDQDLNSDRIYGSICIDAHNVPSRTQRSGMNCRRMIRAAMLP